MPNSRTAVLSPARQAHRALVVDPDEGRRTSLCSHLRRHGCTVTGLPSLVEAGDAGCQGYDVAIIDPSPPEFDRIAALQAANRSIQLLMVAAEGIESGPWSTPTTQSWTAIQRPVLEHQVSTLVEHLNELQRLRELPLPADEESAPPGAGGAIFSSRSPAMLLALNIIRRAALFDIPVLLRGESGTGKGALAKALHRLGDRADEPFVTVNCPTLTDELLTSELFGHVKGSFTGAVRDQAGKVEVADGGSLFLDELGDLSPSIQAKLLRFLEEKTYERVGDPRTRLADVRIIAATNRDLEALVRDGLFREDLLYRLNVIEITLPSLRERSNDLLQLANSFMASFCKAAKRPTMEFSPAACQMLLGHAWPGNVRELRNEIQRVTVLCPTHVVEPDSFSVRVRGEATAPARVGGEHSLAAIEDEHIRQVLAMTATFEEAAAILGIESSTLWRKRRRLGL